MRKIKNILMIILIGLTIGCIYYTFNHIKSNNFNQNFNMEQMGNPGDNGNMGDKPDKPDGEDNMNSNDVPEKPDGEDNMGGGDVPDKPDGENNFSNDLMISFGDNQNFISTKYYLIFGLENLVLVSLVLYLLISKFNKKSFNDSLPNLDKKIIFLLISIIFSIGLTYLDSNIVKNKNGTSQENNLNGESSINYSANTTITNDSTITSGEYVSTSEDENAILVDGNVTATLSNISVSKTGDSDGGDNTSFYGINSGIVARNGATLTLKNISVTTNATGGNGVFSYGGSATTNNESSDGTTINISDSKITTSKDNSGGIMATGGGNLNATNLTISTSGISSAAIRSDRGGGTINVTKGTYTTNGAGSPAIYSTANITVNDAKLVSKVSEGIVIEGKNSVTINSCELTDSNTKLNGQSTTYKNIFLYQSMSGDAADGSSVFTAKDSTITTNKGDTLYVTNTTAKINLENNTIINNDSTGNFLRIQKDSWGNSGANGGDVSLRLTNQSVKGNIVVDEISKLDMNLESNSYYEGIINGDNTAKTISLSLDKTSKIKLTGDCYVTSLTNKDSSNSNIDFNGYKLYVNGVSIN